MKATRILYIDILKLFAIFLVIWGHAIMHFQPDYDQSYIFQTIYSFHMPLFMMMSGYFATSSMNLPAKEFFLKKFRQ
jgi:fucose 4-O-acetylase-like acetyltransferase